MPDSVNYGISARNVSARNVAVGHNAQINVAADVPEISEQLAALRSAIESFDGDHEARVQLAAAGEEVAKALEEPAPDKQRVLSRLSTIASAAGSAGAIASAATALAGAVQAIL